MEESKIPIERQRVLATKNNTGWKQWGPYLSERQWGTVREDYSEDGSAWDYFPHDHARSRAYRWGEDGILGISDNKQNICFCLAMWNKKDPIIKERIFGLNGKEGNHGEDVKEYYYYLESTPTHSYMKGLYKYPQNEFPYSQLVYVNRTRTKNEPEYELIDTGIFDNDEYFDVFVEYAKNDPTDILIYVTICNRSNNKTSLFFLPKIWYRNIWSWGYGNAKPLMKIEKPGVLSIQNIRIGDYKLYYEGNAEPLFCENETNYKKLFGVENAGPFVKDGVNDYLVHGKRECINPENFGTVCYLKYDLEFEPKDEIIIRLRLTKSTFFKPFQDFDCILNTRKKENDEFYAWLQKSIENEDERLIQRQAYAGLMWSKQYYHLNMNQWLNGDPATPKPPEKRKQGRNHNWKHMNCENIIHMPDKWEYPWFAAWDLAFHTIPICRLDPWFAKRQLEILLREYYMHPNGQIPAYEWHFGDVNPPVHAWATWRVYEIDKSMNNGVGDIDFLEKIFHKLLLNFTWWVNQKDSEGNNIFEGGFLGLDNIGVFDRSRPLPTGGFIEQADGTSWMAMYCLNMLRIALEISLTRPIYQDMASKFFEHFLYIAGALNNIGNDRVCLWDEEDSFFFDVLHLPNGQSIPLKIRSMVGIIPLFAVETLEPEVVEKLPVFKRRVEWVLQNRPDLAQLISRWHVHGKGETRLLALVRSYRLTKVLEKLLDEQEFLSRYGIRALSKYHEKNPYNLYYNGEVYSVKYVPGESDTTLFGGNSNWRGPIWIPVNYLLVESLLEFHCYYGDDFKVDFPTGSGEKKSLKEIAECLSQRIVDLFMKDEHGRRKVFGDSQKFQNDPHFKDYILFYEYFHGDNGRGVGASHQTGWTACIADLIHDFYHKKSITK
jgi:hypothetical protein